MCLEDAASFGGGGIINLCTLVRGRPPKASRQEEEINREEKQRNRWYEKTKTVKRAMTKGNAFGP
jgi:hypothetical protein